MSRKLKEDLEKIYGGMLTESQSSMTVGTTKPGELDGPTKEKGPKSSGAESTDADTAKDAPAELQGDTVEKSKKGSGKGKSKFEELYRHVVAEEIEGGIEDASFDDVAGDFPPAGGDEEAAEDMDGIDDEKSLADLFREFGDVAMQIADKYAEEEGVVDDGELIDDEMGLGDDEALAGEAVESTPAPEATAKLQSKGNMNTKAVKVVKKEVSSASSGEENGGKTKKAADTNLGPKMKFKSNGSGAAVDGKNASAFE